MENEDLTKLLKDFFSSSDADTPVPDNLVTFLSVSSRKDIEKALEQIPIELQNKKLLLYYGMKRDELLEQLSGEILKVIGPNEMMETVSRAVFGDKEILFKNIVSRIRSGSSFMGVYVDFLALEDDELQKSILNIFDKEKLSKEISDTQVRLAYLMQSILVERVEAQVLDNSDFSEIANAVLGPLQLTNYLGLGQLGTYSGLGQIKWPHVGQQTEKENTPLVIDSQSGEHYIGPSP